VFVVAGGRGVTARSPVRPRGRRGAAGTAGALLAVALVALAVGESAEPAAAAPPLPAFPGAEGFGAGATGGRGGDVVIVTTLEPFGPGSLGDAVAPEDCRPRIVVFAVSGVIEVPGRHDLELTCGNLTIAGQTAPGAGITVNGRLDGYGADPAGNVIIRHVRFRPPPITDEEGADDDLGQIYDALQMSNNSNVVLDHLSLSWGSDETLDLYEFASDVTVQWTTIEQSNPHGQPEGPHNDGMMVGPDSPRVTVHHVLFAHHDARCPAMGSGPIELLNSTIYDCQDAFVHHNDANGEFHIAGNTFIHGPSHEEFTPIYLDDEDPGGSTYWLYQNDIRAPGQFEGVVDDIADTPLAEAAFAGAEPSQVIDVPTDFASESDDYVAVSTQPPAEASAAVLEQAGAFPRDAITLETVDDVRNGTGDWEPDPPDDLLQGLTPTAPPPDEDADGMADAWEAEHGLDADDGSDHASVMPSGYTAIEEYVNDLADLLVGPPPAGSTAEPPSGAPGEERASDDGEAEGDGADGGDDGDDGDAAQPAVPVAATGDDDSTDALTYVALVLSIVAIALSVVAVVMVRRRVAAPPPGPSPPRPPPGPPDPPRHA
jgi:pectate lyase